MSRRAGLLPLLLLLLVSGAAAAQPAPAPAPDPRRGERLDGRPAPSDPLRTPRAVASGALWLPRTLIEALFWPPVQLVKLAERHHVPARIYWTFTSDDRLVGLRPEARYETGLVTSLGLRFFDRRSLGPGSLIELRARSGGFRFGFAEMRLRPPHHPRLIVEMRSSFERDSDQLFGGIHGQRRSELRADGRDLAHFHVDRALSGAHLASQLVPPLLLGLSGELDLRRYRSSRSLDELYCDVPRSASCAGVDDVIVPGFSEGLRVLRARARALLDTRQGRRRVGGLRLELDGSLARGILGDPSLFARFEADARVVLDLSDRALILRANVGLVSPLGDAPVPFDQLMSPSGDGLRGLATGRLRGHSQLFASVEYRWLLAPYLDASLFVDRGGAFERGFEGVSYANMIPSYGLGLRLHRIRGDHWNAAPLLRIQVAHAPGEGTRLLLGLGGGD